MGLEFNNQQIYTLYDIENWWNRSNDQIYELSGAAGTGKAQPITTNIPTPDGYKLLGNLKIGDYVFDRNGQPTKITGIYDQGILDNYMITLRDGRTIKCNSEHLFCVRFPFMITNKIQVKSLRDVLKTIYNEYNQDHRKYSLTMDELINFFNVDKMMKVSIPICQPVEYPKKEFEMTPFQMGREFAKYHMCKYDIEYSSIEQREEFLDGYHSEMGIPTNNYHIKKFSVDYRSLYALSILKRIISSLGYTYVVNTRYKNKRLKLDPYIEVVYSTYCEDNEWIDIVSVKKLNPAHMRCIYVDNSEHLYLSDEYVVTHNTTLIKYFIDRIGIDLDRVAFLAYQGKAAMQMARNGLPAQTIHSFIYKFKRVLDLDENGKIKMNEKGKPMMKNIFILRESLPRKVDLIVLDEASMINENISKDILSFGIPVIALGDLNQLPPVFGKPFFLTNPNAILTQVMRQSENNPIIWLSQRVLNNEPLQIGVYGKSSVITKMDLNDYILKKSDIVLTGTNRLRSEINRVFREDIYNYRDLALPNVGEKIICRKNNWNRSLDDIIYLTNGMSGEVTYVEKESYNGKRIKIDFKPDFLNKKFKNLFIDYKYLFSTPGDIMRDDKFGYKVDRFEFGYAITVHLSQGSQYGNVVYLNEKTGFDKDTYRKLQYTAITRAMDQITIVI